MCVILKGIIGVGVNMAVLKLCVPILSCVVCSSIM